MKIYTKRGDLGETDLISRRVVKSDIAIQLVGEIDEASARLALCKHYIDQKEILDKLSEVDHYLFLISSIIVDDEDKLKIQIPESAITQLETDIDQMDKVLPPLKRFITYDGSIEAIQISLLRTQVRKVERLLVDYPTQKTVLKYMNRLSDYLYTLMRYMNLMQNVEETKRS
ncbi:cob(I)yrinic acid a,c-diamide adenosyltransferase [Acholeplasma vituli]|uniref:Corrinoid adenosyltransferase n=1 Tax=Paracholeplasma vituli TaxID=69473 RepID=A0ABT2PXI7_9MOLU|nr:cob(I)yrinic acid a,c-diamide adenosyltransferase [Paracholeplasma vituli]MCU0105675.1 cob(I)yrinic acid a,c-diamide adenosyltransferase [Paracholeplasma vituli]